MNSKSGIVTNSLTDPVCNPGAHLCLLFGVNMYFMVWFLSAKFNLHFNDLSVLQTMNVKSFGYIIKNRLIILKFSGYSDYSNLGVGVTKSLFYCRFLCPGNLLQPQTVFIKNRQYKKLELTRK